MKKGNHPNFDMLKSFLEYLRDEEYTLLGNTTFTDNSIWAKTPPRKGDSVSINIYFKGKVPTDNGENILIKTFLDDYND